MCNVRVNYYNLETERLPGPVNVCELITVGSEGTHEVYWGSMTSKGVSLFILLGPLKFSGNVFTFKASSSLLHRIRRAIIAPRSWLWASALCTTS